MHNSLEQLTKLDQDWRPVFYPPVASVEWRRAFAVGTAQAKKNIAACWLYSFDQAYQLASSEEMLREIAHNTLFIRDIKPFINDDASANNINGAIKTFVDVPHLSQLL